MHVSQEQLSTATQPQKNKTHDLKQTQGLKKLPSLPQSDLHAGYVRKNPAVVWKDSDSRSSPSSDPKDARACTPPSGGATLKNTLRTPAHNKHSVTHRTKAKEHNTPKPKQHRYFGRQGGVRLLRHAGYWVSRRRARGRWPSEAAVVKQEPAAAR